MNKVMLIGNVGVDPEVRYVDQGVAVARVRLATTERGYTLANGTQVPDRTDWHTVLLWRNSMLRDAFVILRGTTSRVFAIRLLKYGLTTWNC